MISAYAYLLSVGYPADQFPASGELQLREFRTLFNSHFLDETMEK